MSGVGTVFVACQSCRTQVEVGSPICPQCGQDPNVEPEGLQKFVLSNLIPGGPLTFEEVNAYLESIGAAQVVGEHSFPADPRALPICEHCGTKLDDAAKPCGPR